MAPVSPVAPAAVRRPAEVPAPAGLTRRTCPSTVRRVGHQRLFGLGPREST